MWIVTYDDRVAPIKSIEAVAAPDFMAFQSQSSTLDRVVAFDTSMERVDDERRRGRDTGGVGFERCSGISPARRRRSAVCRGAAKTRCCCRTRSSKAPSMETPPSSDAW